MWLTHNMLCVLCSAKQAVSQEGLDKYCKYSRDRICMLILLHCYLVLYTNLLHVTHTPRLVHSFCKDTKHLHILPWTAPRQSNIQHKLGCFKRGMQGASTLSRWHRAMWHCFPKCVVFQLQLEATATLLILTQSWLHQRSSVPTNTRWSKEHIVSATHKVESLNTVLCTWFLHMTFSASIMCLWTCQASYFHQAQKYQHVGFNIAIVAMNLE